MSESRKQKLVDVLYTQVSDVTKSATEITTEVLKDEQFLTPKGVDEVRDIVKSYRNSVTGLEQAADQILTILVGKELKLEFSPEDYSNAAD
jgi:hypothetical protein